MGIFSKGKPARSEAPEFIEVGQIVNTHGVKGDVKVQPWDVTPAQLAGFKALYMDGTQFRPTDRRIQGDMVLMHFPGWDDMTAAETLKTKILSIKRSEVQLKKGEFLDAELIGMQVYEDFIHRYVGTVEEVLTYPAHKLYKVRGPEKCYLIPAVQDIFIVDIDAEKREIYVKMIEGLETNADCHSLPLSRRGGRDDARERPRPRAGAGLYHHQDPPDPQLHHE